MEPDPIPSFFSIKVEPGKPKKLTVDDDTCACISNIGIFPTNPFPESGRVVVSITPVNDDGKPGKAIALAPLIAGKTEVVQVDLIINSFQPVIFSTSGAPFPVTISGTTETNKSITIEEAKL